MIVLSFPFLISTSSGKGVATMLKALENTVRLFQDMNPIVEKTVFLKFKAVDDALLPLSKNIGFEVDMLTVSTAFLLYP